MRHHFSVAIVVLSTGFSPCFAGVMITSTNTNFASQEKSPISAFVETDRLKIVTPQSTVIFRGDLMRTWVVGMGTYVEITPEVVTAFAARLAAAQTPGSPEQIRLQERLAKLPPQQRAVAEEQLRGLSGGTSAQQATYAKTGTTKTVASGRCEVYGKSVGGQKQEELCIAPISALGLTDADFRALDLFSTFMGPIATQPIAPRADYLNWAVMNKAIGFSGIPLEAMLLNGGQPALQDTMQKVERANIPAAEFDLPPGLTKRELTGLR